MNDERPIEKLLRRAAQKRSDASGTPPELHPANRRLLQAEVARQFPPAKATPREAAPPFWVALTRRWAYALALIPVIGIVALVVLPTLSKPKSKSQMELAKNVPLEFAPAPATLTDESITPAASAVVAVVTDSAQPIQPGSFSAVGSGNLKSANYSDLPAVAAAPPSVLPQARTDRLGFAGSEPTGGATIMTNSASFNRENERVAYQYERRAEPAPKRAQTESFSRAAVPASVATGATLARNNAVTSNPGAAAAGSVASGLEKVAKLEEQTLVNDSVARGKEFDASSALGAKDRAEAVAVTGVAQDGYNADKSWIARGGGAERQQTVLNSQAFSNLGVSQSESKRNYSRGNGLTPPVLLKFKVEQAGRDLRVVDGDGSIYKGVVDEENTLYKQISARQEQKLAIANDSKFNLKTPKQTEAVSAMKKLEAETYYLYRVEGTNRTLNQNVVFAWNFMDTNALAAGTLNYQNTAQKLDATKQPSPFPALLQNSFINGRAQFGEGRTIEVNAVPVQP
ncbi:MAG: hypothetical protein QM813_24140 [Verrucomicrobiota bacterium]